MSERAAKKDGLSLKGLGGDTHAFNHMNRLGLTFHNSNGELNDFQVYRDRFEMERDGTKRNIWSSDYTQDYTPAEKQTSENHPMNKKGLAAAAGVLFALLGKFKALIVLLFAESKAIISAAQLGGLFTTIASMAVMVWAHAMFFGFAYALGFVLLIFFHEMGHYLVAKDEKLNVSGPVFIPFVGAIINMKETPRSVSVEAKVALGGPVLGSLASVGMYLLYLKAGNPLFLSLAYIGGLINLFNLIPVRPLDGGRIVAAVSPLIWVVGIVLLGAVYLMTFSPLILMIGVIGALQIFSYFKKEDGDKHYYRIPNSERITFASVYFGLVALLAVGTMYCFELLKVVNI